MNRRHFLHTLAGTAVVALPAVGWARPEREEKRRRRLACNSWPLRGYFDTPLMHHHRDPRLPLVTQAGFPAFLADTFGIHAVEFLPQHFAAQDRAGVMAEVADVKKGLARAHSTAVNLMGVDLRGGLYNPHLDSAAAIAEGKMWIDVAQALGAPTATFALNGPLPQSLEEGARTVAGHLAPILDYARTRGIRILFHNDDVRRESAEQILAVLRRLGAGTGTCPDFGNYAPRGPAYAVRTIERLLPYAHHICHAKTGVPDHGQFVADDFPASMAATRRVGFRGYYSLEYEGLGPAVAGIRELADWTLRLM